MQRTLLTWPGVDSEPLGAWDAETGHVPRGGYSQLLAVSRTLGSTPRIRETAFVLAMRLDEARAATLARNGHDLSRRGAEGHCG
jgi:hypothetical protein